MIIEAYHGVCQTPLPPINMLGGAFVNLCVSL